MICPFRWFEIKREIQEPFKHFPLKVEDADGVEEILQLISNNTTTTTTKEFYECEKENCGCYIEGRCNRRQI